MFSGCVCVCPEKHDIFNYFINNLKKFYQSYNFGVVRDNYEMIIFWGYILTFVTWPNVVQKVEVRHIDGFLLRFV